MLVNGDCLEEVQKLVDKGMQVDSIVTDPPYHLTSIVERFGKEGSAPAKDKDGAFQRQSVGFMGKEWDGGDIAFRKETWELFMKVLKLVVIYLHSLVVEHIIEWLCCNRRCWV